MEAAGLDCDAAKESLAPEWSLVYDDFEPKQEKLREALCTLGNGYFATRGAAPESRAGDVHYPGTYLAGGYNRLTTQIADREIENEDLVNLPNWLPLNFRIEDGDWFSLDSVEILSFRQELDLQCGVLRRTIRFRDSRRRETTLRERRLVHMDQSHLAAIETTLTADNWAGRVTICSALDGRVINDGVERYRDLNSRHLEPLGSEPVEDDSVLLDTRTTQSKLRVVQAARTRLFIDDEPVQNPSETIQKPAYIALHLTADLHRHGNLRIEKTIAMHTSQDAAIADAGTEARAAISRAGGFNELLKSHSLAWSQLWRRFGIDLCLDGDQDSRYPVSMVLRLHIFHLLQTISIHSTDMDVGVPSRGWHGEAYRGHVFWDELFVFPLFNLRLPKVTQALLKYRYRRLDEARAAAAEAGFRGAMFPWQSGSSGREESQVVHLNPKSGRWIPDNSHLQRHVNAAIAYNAWRYYEVTASTEFLVSLGAELILEIARFWSSIATYNPDHERYEILGVMGPDEYHEDYPGQQGKGLDNNAYTNIMAVWVLRQALEMLKVLPEDRRTELRERLALGDEELERWDEVSRRMRVVFHGDGIISQFERYDELEEFDWDGYREKYGDIQRLDRILKAEDDTPNRYKVSKQADVLMLFYLFSSEELAELFERLGYRFERDTIPKNVDYYLKRTSHGSTLSRVVHAWVLARSDRERSWRMFDEALKSDLTDIQGGTTPEGIHLGAMAGTVDLMERCYTGIVTRNDVLWFNPRLPEEISPLRMQVRYRQHSLDLEFRPGRLTVRSFDSSEPPILIGVNGRISTLEAGETREYELA